MPTGEAPLVVDQLYLTIEESTIDQHNNIVDQAPHDQLQLLTHDQKHIFRPGLYISLISVGGILNPPITATTLNKTNSLHSDMFHFTLYLSLAIGVLLIVLSTILNRMPRSIMIFIAKPLTKIGWALATVTLGYGPSLVLMVSSSPWFALYVIFLTIRFM